MTDSATPILGAANTLLTAAGDDWDVVKIGRFVGLQALNRIGSPGAVAVDPAPAEPALYFFIPAGSVQDWDVPQTRALGATAWVVLPPAERTSPPGPYWLVAPERGLTPTAVLRCAVQAALSHRSGSMPAPLDLARMRSTAQCLIDEPVQLPTGESLAALTLRIRGHLSLLIPEIVRAAAVRPSEDISRLRALSCVGEAGARLQPLPVGDEGTLSQARRLAHSLTALCDHYQHLYGQ
jgi:hypothetical protein